MDKSKQDLKKVKKNKKIVKQDEIVEEEANKKVIAIIVIVLIAILGLIIGGVIYFNSNGDKGQDNTKEKKLVRGKTLKVLEPDYDDIYIALLDEVRPTLNIYGETYQAKVINATISAKDNEKLKSVEYAFSDNNIVEPSYTKIETRKKKFSKDVSYDTGTNSYKVTYLWVKVTDNANNTEVMTKEFITAEYVDDVPLGVRVNGDLIINSSGVILSDLFVKGNIYITKNVGLGEVTLNNVEVGKNIYVNGGGTNSINLNNIKVNKKIIVNNENHVRLNFMNTKNEVNLDLMTDTTLQTDESTGNKVSANVIGDITVLIDGKVNKIVVKGNAVVKTKEGASDTASMQYVDVTEANNAKVLGYVTDTNYNITTNKDSMVSPVAELNVIIDSDFSDTDVIFKINREIKVTRIEETSAKEAYRENIRALLNAIKSKDQAKINEVLINFTSSDIIVVVTYIDNNKEEKTEIKSAALDEIVENDNNYYKAPTVENENVYVKDAEYKIDDCIHDTDSNVQGKTIIIEKDPNSDTKNMYEQSEEKIIEENIQ